ncbi:MAG: alpha/beta fold hydrolase [Pseudomonadota bacterium]
MRYDERGCGLSEKGPETPDLETWVADLECVIDASGIDAPFALLGISQGASTAITYTIRHPHRVSHLILFGGFARGSTRRGDPEAAALYRAVVEVFRHGLNNPNPTFQDVFTTRFIPDASPEHRQWFNELCQKSTDAEVGANLLLARSEIDVSDLLPQVTVPTLVMHVEGDQAQPIAEAKLMARNIPGAEFTALPGNNHILQPSEPGWAIFRDRLETFLGTAKPKLDATLTDRESAILALICEAKSNKVIAYELGISEKTVRNHATHIFEKLGVSSRQEAILAGKRT